MSGIVLSLCDRTGVMVEPWRNAGWPCWCVDVQHKGDETRNGIRFIGADVTRFLPPKDTAIVFAFPPCTNLAVSGARWFVEKGLYGLADGLEVVARCAQVCEWSESPWMLENPVGTLSSYWRKPDWTFQPWNFGDMESKKTCLWTGGGLCDARVRLCAEAGGRSGDRVQDAAERRTRRPAKRDAAWIRTGRVRSELSASGVEAEGVTRKTMKKTKSVKQPKVARPFAYCAYCGARSDRGCIQVCRQCSPRKRG